MIVENEKSEIQDSISLRRETFLRLMDEYSGALRRLAAAYVREPQNREDLVQEVAVALWQAIPKFRGESSERTWLYRIAHNTAITAAAKLRRRDHVEFGTDEIPDRPALSSASGDEQLILKQKREWLFRAVRELPTADRQILALHLEDLTNREIQDIVGLSEGAVAARLSRLRTRLAADIQKREVHKR